MSSCQFNYVLQSSIMYTLVSENFQNTNIVATVFWTNRGGIIRVRRLRHTSEDVKCRQCRTYGSRARMVCQSRSIHSCTPHRIRTTRVAGCWVRTVCDSFEYRRRPNKSLTVIRVVLRFQIRLHEQNDFTFHMVCSRYAHPFTIIYLSVSWHSLHKCSHRSIS